MYKCNIPFHVTDTLVWQAMITSVAKLGVDNFQGPCREAFQTHLLCFEVEHILTNIECLKVSQKKYDCSIITHGWSDIHRCSIINILVSNCKGAIFLDSIDTSAKFP